MPWNVNDCLIYEGYFFIQGPIGREIRTTVRIRWSFAQMSLVCPSIATHRTGQFWAPSEPVNMPKTIVSRQMWSAWCNSIPLFQNKRRGVLSSGIVLLHGNTRPHTAAATKRLLKRFRWEVFDHPSSTRTWLPVISISFLVWNGRWRTIFWHNKLQTSVENWLKAQAVVFYDEDIGKVVPRYEKCLRRSAGYVEK